MKQDYRHDLFIHAILRTAKYIYKYKNETMSYKIYIAVCNLVR